MPLNRIRVVLVATSHAGNIGACARAMKTMGLRQLVLVAPHAFPDPEATARAAGADDILAAARVCATLDEAIGDCQLVIGTSARHRRIPWPLLTPREAASRVVHAAEQHEVALLFGRERTGLLNEELDRCQALVTIPADPDFSSLNLASAVQVLSYEIRCAGLHDAENPSPAAGADLGEPLATAADVQRFYEHLEQVLTQAQFLDPDNPRLLMRRLMRLFNRVTLTTNEVNILRGILSALSGQRDRPGT